MANIWLPIKDVRGQRETILFIPGASSMDKSQVQEIVAKQKEAIAATNKVKIKINSKELEMTEYVYKTGGYFTIVAFPAPTLTPPSPFFL